MEKDSPIAGMPIIDAYKSKQVIVMKRGMGSGYADIVNPMVSVSQSAMLLKKRED